MSHKILDYFQMLKEQDKIGHAYLICNCDLKSIESELNACFSKCFFDYNVDIRSHEDIIIVEPEGNLIKKDEIQKIHEKVKKTSQISGCKIYIINQCEKMNDFASNSLLKLLEEPEKNVFAILITSNVDCVLKTIYSRCQILKFFNDDYDDKFLINQSEENIKDAIRFVEYLNKYKTKVIAHYSFITKRIKERDFSRNFFTLLLLVYRDILNIKLDKQVCYFKEEKERLNNISVNFEIDSIVEHLSILSKYISYVDMNLNTNLLLDRFIIEVAGE